METLKVHAKYGDREFTMIVSPPSTASEYLGALHALAVSINEVAEIWAVDARREYWETITNERTTREEF